MSDKKPYTIISHYNGDVMIASPTELQSSETSHNFFKQSMMYLNSSKPIKKGELKEVNLEKFSDIDLAVVFMEPTRGFPFHAVYWIDHDLSDDSTQLSEADQEKSRRQEAAAMELLRYPPKDVEGKTMSNIVNFALTAAASPNKSLFDNLKTLEDIARPLSEQSIGINTSFVLQYLDNSAYSLIPNGYKKTTLYCYRVADFHPKAKHHPDLKEVGTIDIDASGMKPPYDLSVSQGGVKITFSQSGGSKINLNFDQGTLKSIDDQQKDVLLKRIFSTPDAVHDHTSDAKGGTTLVPVLVGKIDRTAVIVLPYDLKHAAGLTLSVVRYPLGWLSLLAAPIGVAAAVAFFLGCLKLKQKLDRWKNKRPAQEYELLVNNEYGRLRDNFEHSVDHDTNEYRNSLSSVQHTATDSALHEYSEGLKNKNTTAKQIEHAMTSQAAYRDQYTMAQLEQKISIAKDFSKIMTDTQTFLSQLSEKANTEAKTKIEEHSRKLQKNINSLEGMVTSFEKLHNLVTDRLTAGGSKISENIMLTQSEASILLARAEIIEIQVGKINTELDTMCVELSKNDSNPTELEAELNRASNREGREIMKTKLKKDIRFEPHPRR
ncbi:TPA: hypothetical protein ACXNHW_004810 [Pseudomonas aeruginosa]